VDVRGKSKHHEEGKKREPYHLHLFYLKGGGGGFQKKGRTLIPLPWEGRLLRKELHIIGEKERRGEVKGGRLSKEKSSQSQRGGIQKGKAGGSRRHFPKHKGAMQGKHVTHLIKGELRG